MIGRYVKWHQWPDWNPAPETAVHHIHVHDMAMAATHDVPCPVCMNEKALLTRDMTPGSRKPHTFQPCDRCQQQGWRTIRLPKWLRRWMPGP